MDNASTVLDGHEQDLEAAQKAFSRLHDQLEDYENSDCCGNFHIKVLPKTIEDLRGCITALFQELVPDHQ